MSRTRAWVHQADYSFPAIRELDSSWGRAWQDRLSDPGSGQLNLQNDDPDLADCSVSRIVRFDIDDQPRFAMVVEGQTIRAVTSGEEADEFTEVRGRGTMAIWEQMVVYPEYPLGRKPFADDRLFNFTSRYYSDAAWGTAVVTPDDDTGGAGDNYGDPPGWPDAGALWIWDRSSEEDGVPIGDCYFRKTFTTVNTSEIRVELRAAADDAYEIWIDGVPLLTDGPIYGGQSKHVQFGITNGEHLIAVRARNDNVLKAGLRVTLMTVNDEGDLVDVLVRTDATWKVLGYPATVPGFTAGRIINILRTEALARASFAGWSALEFVALGFTNTQDSGGAAWPEIDTAFRIGLDGLSMLRQLAETYIDMAMRPGSLILDAWARGTKGGEPAVSMVPASNLTELTIEVQG